MLVHFWKIKLYQIMSNVKFYSSTALTWKNVGDLANIFHLEVRLSKFLNCDTIRNLVPLVQFKKRKKHPWMRVSFSKVIGWSLIFLYILDQERFTLLQKTFFYCLIVLLKLSELEHFETQHKFSVFLFRESLIFFSLELCFSFF